MLRGLGLFIAPPHSQKSRRPAVEPAPHVHGVSPDSLDPDDPDWQALGRKGQFAFRGLVAGPPPASHKKKNALSLIFQDGEFDKVVDLVEKGPPTAQLLVDLTSAPSAKP